MKMDLNGFNAAEIEPIVGYDPLPAGWYRAVITASEERVNKSQTGSYLQLTLEVIEGQHQGRKLIDRLNLNNPNQTAVEIAQRTLSGICRAVGVMTPRTSYDLHDRPLMVKVKVRAGEGDYGPSNEIVEYAPPEKATAVGVQAKSPLPWKRGNA
jgi:hypothetical protein